MRLKLLSLALSIDGLGLRRRVVQFRMSASYDTQREKKLRHFDKKIQSLAELKFDPAKWVTGEYLSQIDSTLIVKLMQHCESNWLN